MMELYLQSRWRLEGKFLRYYGLRKKPYLLENTIKLKKKERAALSALLSGLAPDLKALSRLIEREIIVPKEKIRTVPSSLDQARFCHSCVANDFMIPGIEFDDEGLCPMCASAAETEKFQSVLPVKSEFPRSRKSRFDVAVFYTGGKDSTYLLYYLAKVKGLRVLALTWEIPFISPSAEKSIASAKRCFPNVEFVSRRVSDDDLRKIYRKLFKLNGNTCACPSLAYVLFYPLLVGEKVPYFVAGYEPAQMKNLYYNNMAPPIAYRFSENKFLNFLLNLGRALTLRKPFRPGQFHALATMRQLAFGDSFFKKISGYKNVFLSNVIESLHEVPAIVKPLKRAVRVSSLTGNIPAFVHVDFNKISPGGVYKWEEVKSLLVEEAGWAPPAATAKGLHTSCSIEKCKEHTQFVRFYRMESPMIPFSAIELALVTRDKNLTREQAIAEIKHHLGFSLTPPVECALMEAYMDFPTK